MFWRVNQNTWKNRVEEVSRAIATARPDSVLLELNFAGYMTAGELENMGVAPAYAMEQSADATLPSALVRVPDVLFKVVIDPGAWEWAVAHVVNHPLLYRPDDSELAYGAPGMLRLLGLAVPSFLWPDARAGVFGWRCLSLDEMAAGGGGAAGGVLAAHCEALAYDSGASASAPISGGGGALPQNGIDQVLLQLLCRYEALQRVDYPR